MRSFYADTTFQADISLISDACLLLPVCVGLLSAENRRYRRKDLDPRQGRQAWSTNTIAPDFCISVHKIGLLD